MKKIIQLLVLLFVSNLVCSQNTDYKKIKEFGYEKIPLADRISDLTYLYQEINYNFAFFDRLGGLKWKTTFEEYKQKAQKTETRIEFIRLLQQFMAVLQEGHTNAVPSLYLTDYFGASPALELDIIENQVFIANTSKQLRNKISVGSTILKVNGLHIKKHLKNNVFPYLSASSECNRLHKSIRLFGEPGVGLLVGQRDHLVTLTYRTAAGDIKSEKLKRYSRRDTIDWQKKPQHEKKPFSFQWVQSRIALIEINDFSKKEIKKEFDKVWPLLRNAKGIIFDVRKNWGGNSANGAYLISHFIKAPLIPDTWKSREHIPVYKAYGKRKASKYRDYFTGNSWIESKETKIFPSNKKNKTRIPVIALSSCNSYSATEDFLNYVDALPNGIVIGQKSAASTGQPWIFKLNQGTYVAITAKRNKTFKGLDIVGNGIEPDVLVNQTIEAYLNKKDLVLDAAIKKIQSLK